MKGYVYIISNKVIPDLYKIGYTMKDPQIRASELSTTGVPHDYFVEYEILVDNPYDIEQSSHRILEQYKEGKEWFRCSFMQAIDAIKSSYNGNIYYEHSFRLDLDKNTFERNDEENRKHLLEAIQKNKQQLEHEIKRLYKEIESREESEFTAIIQDKLKRAKFFSFFASLMPIFIFYNSLDIWLMLMFFSCGVVLYYCSKNNIVNTEKEKFHQTKKWQSILNDINYKINNKQAKLDALLKQESIILTSTTSNAV